MCDRLARSSRTEEPARSASAALGETWVFNAGHQFGAPPTHIVIDTEAQQAIWISAAGVQSVRLDRPLERPVAKLSELPDWLTAPDSEDDRIPA